MIHDFKNIEPKWQKAWEDAHLFEASDADGRPKFYGLVEFPYPSGHGMHVGHIKAYSGLEVVSRKRRMQGYNVLFPIGFDAFGLPTENSAIKFGVHPRQLTDENIKKFTGQLKRVGFSFDWSRVIDTTDESYYRWTQWIFLKMFEKGLAFRDKTLVNYCPKCRVVLSNEDSQGGKCDLCGSEVVQKSKDVWYLRITEYADKLLEGLDSVDYLPMIRQQQENWIGRSTGAFIDFPLRGISETLRVYTTRCDTLFGVTFMVMAPEHPLLDRYADRISNMKDVLAYREQCAKKTEFERTQLVKDKTGIRISGLTAVHPFTGKDIPIFISDYVMMGYGTGAIMAVPAHDSRDYAFAKEFGAEIIPVIEGGDISKEAYSGDGKMIHSEFLNGITDKKTAIARMLEELQKKGIGEAAVQYKMKDWAFNRQRYWGEPIPIVHCPNCGMVGVPYEELPLRLPPTDRFEPGEGGESPLAKMESFVNCVCPKCGGQAKRETDTMPQWAGSSWYYLRYIDPRNDECIADPEKLKYWLPVDWYNGGMEHVTRHMIYSRFWHRFLYDLGVVPTKEPYAKRTAQGLVLGANGVKMSKSLGNVVDPNDVVDSYGADVLRTYVLFMGDYEQAAPWSDSSVKGCKRFIERFAALTDMIGPEDGDLTGLLHRTIKKVSDDIENMKFNTAIAAMMAFLNEVYAKGSIDRESLMVLTRLLSPFAPHITEEVWHTLGGSGFCSTAPWPVYDESKAKVRTVEIAVQICGKLRGRVTIGADDGEEEAMVAVMADEGLRAALEGKQILKKIYVPGRLMNLVVR